MAVQGSRKGRRLQSLLEQAGSQLALGDEDGAAQTLRKLARESECPPFALEQLGLILLRRGDIQAGATFLRRSLTPSASAEQITNAGYALMLAGDLGAAEKLLLRALERDPNIHPAHNNLALLFQRTGDNARALRHFAEATRLAPDNWGYLSNAATLKYSIGDYEGALEGFAAAVAKGGGSDAQVLSNLAQVQTHFARLDEAVATCDRAIALAPNLADAHINRANALKSLQRHDDACVDYERALALRLDDAGLYFAQADNFNAMGRFAEALDSIAEFLRLSAQGLSAETRGQMAALGRDLYAFECLPAIYRDEQELRAARQALEQRVAALSARIDALVASRDPRAPRLALRSVFMVSLFFVAYQGLDDKPVVSAYADAVGTLFPARDVARASPPRGERIRIGIASEYLRDHNGSKWAYEWLSRLPADKYKFFSYAFHAIEDEFTRKFAALGTFRRFQLTEQSFEGVVTTMRADDLHALLLPDVGMTASSRVLSLHRIAPVQFTAWGHPVTSGSPAMDFYLAGDLMEPDDGAAHYRETLVRLPNIGLYLTPTDFTDIEAERFGLPEDRLIYGSVQSLMKYLPQYDRVFPQIAKRVPRALFVFYEGLPAYTTEIFRERLDRAFRAEGLDAAEFVRFLPRTGRRDFLRFLKAIDINVDSIGWSGGYTTLQLLEVGCPTVTLPTQFMRGRMSLGMLKMIGVDDMIVTSEEDFVEKLARLGLDEPHRREVAARIAANKHRLYEDESVIAAFDEFLQRVVARFYA